MPWRRRLAALTVAMAALGAAVIGPAASAQVADGSGPTRTSMPDDWDVDVASLPLAIQVGIPPVLPLDVGAGAGFAGIKVTSLPLGLASAGPIYAPVLDALGLLGGTGALVPILARLLPALVLGGPTIFGLPPLPIDPKLLPVLPLPPLPSPPLPTVQCTANFPGDPREVTCGGPVQGLLGYEVAASSGTGRISGDPLDTGSIEAESAVRLAGFAPQKGQTILPVEVDALAASSRVRGRGSAIEASTAVQLSGIDILGGAIHIDGVRAGQAASLTGSQGGGAIDRDECIVTGMEVAGTPVRVAGDHLTVGTSTQQNPLGPLASELAGAMTKFGSQTVDALSLPLDVGVLEIRPLPASPANVDPAGTRVESRLACLDVTYRIPASGSSMRFTIGQSTLSMSATRTGLASSTGDLGGATDASLSAPASGGGSDGVLGSSEAVSRGPSLPAPPQAIEPGSGAPAPSAVPVFREVAARRATWVFVFIALLLVTAAVPLLARGRRATWRYR